MSATIHFQKKMFFYHSLLVLLLVFLFLGGFFFYAYRNLLGQSEENLQLLSVKTASTLDGVFTDMDKIALYSSTNPAVRQTFHDARLRPMTDTVLEQRIAQTLLSISVPNSAGQYRMTLYNQAGNFISTGYGYSWEAAQRVLEEEEYKSWYQSIPLVPNKRSIQPFQPDPWLPSGPHTLSLYREVFDISDVTETMAVVEVQCPYGVIESLLQLSGGMHAYVYTPQGRQIYPDGAVSAESQALYAAWQGKKVLPDMLYATAPSQLSGWTLLLTRPKSEILVLFQPLIAVAVVLAVLILLLGNYLLYLISAQITAPLRKLRESVQKVTLANLALAVETPEENDEFLQLNSAFDLMFQRLKDAMDENVRMKTHEIRAHMIALQSQMDPHFLYNLIAVIKAMSHEGSTEQIGEVCGYLADMLRYIASYDEGAVPIDQEFDHAENYLRLMKIRYEDQLDYSFQLDPHLCEEEIFIPKLSLQPIVENCFQHGFQEVLPPWKITVRAWFREPKWYISVTDNGSGFPPGEMERLLAEADRFLDEPSAKIGSMKLGGMGLVNVLVRLRLHNKDKMTFRAENLPGKGACVTIGGLCDDKHSAGGG